MIGPIHNLSDWIISFASSDWAIVVLCVTSFLESILFPIPPDPMLITMSLVQPKMALIFAVMVTISSVTGGFVGHWLGLKFGHPIVNRMFPDKWVKIAEDLLLRYGVWATLIAAFTPVPYKVFAISAGTLEMDRRTFIIASMVGRGVRFTLIGASIMFFGDSIKQFLQHNFEILTIVIGTTVVLGIIGSVLIHKMRRGENIIG